MAGVTSAALWALSVAEMNFSLLAGRSGWWGAVYMTSSCHEGNPTCQAHLQGQQGAWALLLWMSCLTVLGHCKGGRRDVLEHQKLIPPFLLFVWGCDGHCSSTGLCPSLGVAAPFGARCQQQNPSRGLSPGHGRASSTVCLLLFCYCLSHDPFPRLTCT